MRITFQETLSKKEWIHKELMQSLTGDVVLNATDNQYYEVKLLVNGVELEPELFNLMMKNIDAILDAEALNIYKEKYEERINKLKEKMALLEETLEEAKDKILEKIDE